MKKKNALIFGISGQDGAYLAHFLLSKNYNVIGITRNNSKRNLFRIYKLNIQNKVKIIKGKVTDYRFCYKIIKKKISEIYYLAGESSIVKSFEFPEISLLSNSVGILNILRIVKIKNKKIRIFNACSGQIFGNKKKNFFNIDSKIDPQSPYGVSKAAGYWFTKIYRENYNMFCCSGILFNHESPLRSNEFVTKKIINGANQILSNKKKYLLLGDVNIYRDWGWAPEFVKAYWLMLQQKTAIDLIIGTGKVYSLKDFVREVFKIKNINIKKLRSNVSHLKRKLDIKGYKANILKTSKVLKWKPKISFKRIVEKMVKDELF
jgi:GDPmannose 4,6-dehydratase